MVGIESCNRTASRRQWWAFHALLFALGACKSAVPATEILLVVHSNLGVGTELNAVLVEVYDRDAGKLLSQRTLSLAAQASDGRYALPVSLSIAAPTQDSSEAIRVVVAGHGPRTQGGPDEDIVEQQAIAHFKPGLRQRLDMFLGRSCLNQLCHDGNNALTDQSCDLVSMQCADVPSFENLPEAKGDGVVQFMLPDGIQWDAGSLDATGGQQATGNGGVVILDGKVNCEGVDLSQATVASNIAEDTTWRGVVHVIDSMHVSGDVTLTVEAGTTVVLDADTLIEIGYVSSGSTLKAEGTEELPITFCGGSGSQGYWRALQINSGVTSDSVLRYVQIGGGGGDTSTLEISAPVTVDHVVITDSASDGVHASAFHAGSANLSIFNAAGKAVVLTAPEAVTPFPLGGEFSDNGENVIALDFETLVNTGMVFGDAGIPYLQQRTTLAFATDDEIKFEAGVTYRFAADGVLEVGFISSASLLTVAGTPEAPVTFEGAASEKGYWGGLVIDQDVLSSSAITYARFRDGGGTERPLSTEAQISLRNVEFEDNARGPWIGAAGLKSNSANISVTGTDGPAARVDANALVGFPTGGSFTGNMVDEIEVAGARITSSGLIPNVQVPYFLDGDIYVWDDLKISIAPGTEFIAQSGVSIDLGEISGAVELLAVGEAANPIIFRGRADEVGYWAGIVIYDTALPTTTFDYVEIHNAGNAGGAGLSLNRPVQVTHTTITKSAGYGLGHKSSDTTDYTITNTFADNTDGAIGIVY